MPGFGFAHSAGVAACLGNLAYAFFQAFLPVFLLFFSLSLRLTRTAPDKSGFKMQVENRTENLGISAHVCT